MQYLKVLQRLTSIAALEKVVHCNVGYFQPALDNRLLSLDFALGEPLCKLLARCWVVFYEVDDDEAFHADALSDDSGYLLQTSLVKFY